MVIAFIIAALKITGIVLLVALTIVLALIALIMLVPVRYELYGEKYEEISISATAEWLLGLLKVSAKHTKNGNTIAVSLAGHNIYPKNKKQKGVKERGSEQAKDKTEENKTVKAEKEPEAENRPKVQPMRKKDKPEPAVKRGDVTPRVVRVKMVEQELEPPVEEEPQTKARFCINYIKAMPKEDKITAIKAVIAFLKGILKHILPKELRLYAVVGTSDPAQTGYILAAAGIARGVSGKDITVQGDFEREVFEGEVSAKGRIRLGSAAVLIIKLALTKPIRKFIFKFLKVRGELL